MSLQAAIRTAIGGLELDVDFEVATGEIVVLLGPNGAGKTSLLRVLAGLDAPQQGRVVLDGKTLEDSTRGFRVPSEKRPIGFVFQDYLLFPHLSALDNIAFGLRAQGVAKKEARRRASVWLDRTSLTVHAASRPGALSGGQRQSVALARALVIEPRLLLLDEPLAALDADARRSMRRALVRHLAGFEGTRLLVTHDPLDALFFADRVIVLEDGRITQAGSPAELTSRPRSEFVARLVGLNLLRGRGLADRVRLPSGGELQVAEPAHGEVLATVRPSSVALFRSRPAGTPRNVWAATVRDMFVDGNRVRLRLDADVPLVCEVTLAAAAELGLADGEPVWAAVKATDVTVYGT
ncbi:ABC transporter ATP-binding protein [soil metagenome]